MTVLINEVDMVAAEPHPPVEAPQGKEFTPEHVELLVARAAVVRAERAERLRAY